MKFNAKFAPLAAMLPLLFATSAGAATIDFIDLTEKAGGLGESSWSSLSASDHPDLNFFGLKITGHATNDLPNAGVADTEQFAYLDWGTAGLGVCKDATGSPSGANPDSKDNSCDPRSDDNVTVGEYLEISFTEDVVVENLWFNNNHDGGFDATDLVTIGLLDYSVATGFADGANGIGPFSLAAGEILKVAYKNEEFYMSGMAVSPVPVPAAVWLFGTALIGFVGLGRRTNVA
jgi:hypothetical protein